MDDSGNVREDLKLPSGHDEAEALARQIKASWDEGKELVLTVLKSMNQEQVNAMKEGGFLRHLLLDIVYYPLCLSSQEPRLTRNHKTIHFCILCSSQTRLDRCDLSS